MSDGLKLASLCPRASRHNNANYKPWDMTDNLLNPETRLLSLKRKHNNSGRGASDSIEAINVRRINCHGSNLKGHIARRALAVCERVRSLPACISSSTEVRQSESYEQRHKNAANLEAEEMRSRLKRSSVNVRLENLSKYNKKGRAKT
eukprot:6209593-Pleurochrysis_carterae.AAC.2